MSRAILAAAHLVTRRHLRGPLLPAVAAAFGLLCLARPDTGEVGSALRIRSGAAALLGSGTLVLLALGAALPLASVSERRGRTAGGRLGPRGWALAAAAGHGGILLFAAALLAAISFLALGGREGWDAVAGREEVLRRRLGVGPSIEAVLAADEPLIRWTGPGPAAGERLLLRLSPRVLVDARAGSASESGATCRFLVDWRPSGAGATRREEIVLRQGRPASVLLDPGPCGAVEIGLRHQSPGLLLQWPVGSLEILGRSEPLVSSLFRGFLGLGFAALSLAALCQWLSGAVSYPLAVAAGLTAVLASAVFSAWIPGMPPVDPGDRVSAGVSFGWCDLAMAALKAVLLGAGAAAAPILRVEGGRRG